MIVVDDVVVNPVEAPMVPARTETSLSEIGLSVIGADWGESAIEGTVRRTASGQVMSDRKGKSRTITLVFMVREEKEVDLPTAAHRFQQIVGELQRRETWIRRDPLLEEHAGPVLFRSSGEVGVRDFLGWQKGESPDVTLTMVADFAGYATEEDESEEFKATTARQLVYTLPPNSGTAQGLKRLRVLNEGEDDWRGLISAEECLDAPEDLSDPTADLAYLAKNLTPKGGAEVKTVSGAEVVQHTGLTAGWLTILHSEIAGVGHMTHRGPRRMWMRIFDPGAEAGNVQLRLLWRALGSSRWTEDNPIVSTYAVGDYSLIDLGECRPQIAALGEERWECQLMARALSGSGAIRIRDVYPLPTEQYLMLSEPDRAPIADAQSTKLGGTAATDKGIGTIEWTNPANVKVEDGNFAFAALAKEGTATTNYLKVTNFGFAIPTGARIAGIIVATRRRRSAAAGAVVLDKSIHLVKGGEIKVIENKASPEPWPVGAEVRDYGGSSDRWSIGWTDADINAAGFGVAVAANLTDIGFGCNAEIDSIAISVYYAEGGDDSTICFAERSLELRSDGCYRQARKDDVWGIMVPDGFLPYASAGGLEGRQARGILIPTHGDLAALPDSGTPNPASGVVWERPGYHFAREAAG